MAEIEQILEQLVLQEPEGLVEFEAEEEGPRVYPEFENIVDDLDENVVAELGSKALEEVKEDESDRQEWLDMHTTWLEMYLQQDKPAIDDDRDWNAIESIPILTEGCNQFQARTRQAFFPNKNFVSATALNRKDNEAEEYARKISGYLNDLFTRKLKRYKRDKDRLFLATAVHGSFFTKSYFDEGKGYPVVDNVRPVDLIVPYTIGPIEIEDLPRKTHKLRLTRHDIRKMTDSGFFRDIRHVYNATDSSDEYDSVVDESQGISTPATQDDMNDAAICTVYEQHRWWDIDGEYKPIIVWVTEEGKVLRLTVRYATDENGEVMSDEPVEYFTHYKFLENPDGFYGLGLGHMVGNLNAAVSDIFRKSRDAAHLANDGNMSGLISDRLTLEGEDVRLDIGKFIPVQDSVGKIADGIYPFNFPGPNAGFLSMGEYLDQRAQRMSATTESLTGQSDAVKQPTTILTEVEQGLAVFTSVQQRLADSMNNELSKVYELVRRYSDDVISYFSEGKMEEIYPEEFIEDVAIEVAFDPRFATQAQKMARAQAELDATLNNPNNQMRPEIIDNAFRRYFEAIETDDIEELMPVEEEVERIDDQQVENMYFLMPEGQAPKFDVFPDQDHEEHLREIDEFVNSEYAQNLTPEAAAKLQHHRQKHLAFDYANQTGILGGEDESVQQGGIGAIPEMGAGPDYSEGIQDIDPAVQEFEAMGGGELLGAPAPIGGTATSVEDIE
jgi:hypothetical protein